MKILHFLKFPILQDKLDCLMKDIQGPYHREKKALPLTPFTEEMEIMFAKIKSDVYEKLFNGTT